jgi:tetratricopeptide (TPR) repeat protein
VLLLCVGGCAVQKLLKQGDAALTAEKPISALDYYQKALSRKPELAQDAAFKAKVQRARYLAAYEQGRQLAERERWEEAMAKFDASLAINPGFAKASEARRQAAKRAAKARHRRALEYANEGKLNEAIEQLRRAGRLDPENNDVKDALDSVQEKKGAALRKAESLHAQAPPAMRQKRWLAAEGLLVRAIASNPNHLPARVKLHLCRTNLAAAREQFAAGRRLLDEKRLDRSIAALEGSLSIWPYHDAAREALAVAQEQRGRAEELYRQAKAHLGKSDWDRAIASAEASLGVFPYHGEARAVMQQAKRSAADELLAAGERLLAAGRLEQAEAAFRRCFTYIPNLAAAREGLARADGARAASAERSDRWGAALLWYLEARSHYSKYQYDDEVRRARKQMADRVAFALRLDVTDRRGAVSQTASDAGSAVLERLDAAAPAFVTLLTDRHRGQAPLRAAVTVGRPDIETRCVRRQGRTHSYTAYRDVPNPRIDTLKVLLADTRRRVRDLGAACARGCPHCHGRGFVTCAACARRTDVHVRVRVGLRNRPTRSKAPPRRGATHRKAGEGSATVAARRSHEPSHCAACHGTRRVRCRYCAGRGRGTPHLRQNLLRAEGRVRSLLSQLRCEPALVTESYTAYWSYTAVQYEKSASLELAVHVEDAASGEALAAYSARSVTSDSDWTIDNANPAVGLSADPLELASDREMVDVLVASTAQKAAGHILEAALAEVAHRAARRAEALAADGNSDASLEAAVDQAILLESLRPSDADALLRNLRRQLTAGM